MSHIDVVKVEIKDLVSLKKACKELGLDFKEGKKTYRWFGRFVGDFPMPEGFTAQDLGKCEHAIEISGDKKAYSVGVVSRKDGKPGYQLLWDFWGGGYGLQEKIGEKGGKLIQAYSVEVAEKSAINEGYTVTRYKTPNGGIRLEVTV